MTSNSLQQTIWRSSQVVRGVLLLLGFAFFTLSLPAQDTLPDLMKAPEHSAHRATLYSAVLPGLGQVYNQKYWKVPVIYAGFATLGYFIATNTKEYRKFRDAYNYVSSGDSTGIPNEYATKYTTSSLLQGREYYQRNMELSYILSGVLYILNIVDAAVDAHLWDFDVSDDLSLRVAPAVNSSGWNSRPVTGLSLQLTFK